MYQPTPSYTKTNSASSGKALRQIGCGVLAIILLILAVCGGVSYFGYQWIRSALDTPGTTQNTPTTNDKTVGVTPTSGPAITTTLNTKPVTYASVNIIILNVQQAASFPGDNDSQSGGILRLNLQEENTASRAASYYYDNIAHLLLPDGNSIALTTSQAATGPDASTKRTNWLDFPVATSIKPEQLTLRLGSSTETQIDIPLKADADLSKYQAKTVTPNKQALYADVTWTITSATKQLSYDARQAENGKCFIVLKLRMDNTSSKTFIAYYGDYIRMKSGDTTIAPDGSSNLPTNIDANQSNVTGTAVFILPEGSTDFTFILLNTPSTGSVPEQTIDFQIT